jgi:hypothetical protein
MVRNTSLKLLSVSTLLLVLALHLQVAKASDPPVTLGRWINYDSGTPDFPSGHRITAVALDDQERVTSVWHYQE